MYYKHIIIQVVSKMRIQRKTTDSLDQTRSIQAYLTIEVRSCFVWSLDGFKVREKLLFFENNSKKLYPISTIFGNIDLKLAAFNSSSLLTGGINFLSLPQKYSKGFKSGNPGGHVAGVSCSLPIHLFVYFLYKCCRTV